MCVKHVDPSDVYHHHNIARQYAQSWAPQSKASHLEEDEELDEEGNPIQQELGQGDDEQVAELPQEGEFPQEEGDLSEPGEGTEVGEDAVQGETDEDQAGDASFPIDPETGYLVNPQGFKLDQETGDIYTPDGQLYGNINDEEEEEDEQNIPE